jgi:hypothetical protein
MGQPLSLSQIANWLVDTALFEQAWARVCMGPLNWWWSEQLCIFTAGAWTVFLAVEGARQSRLVWQPWFEVIALQDDVRESSISGRICSLASWLQYL